MTRNPKFYVLDDQSFAIWNKQFIYIGANCSLPELLSQFQYNVFASSSNYISKNSDVTISKFRFSIDFDSIQF